MSDDKKKPLKMLTVEDLACVIGGAADDPEEELEAFEEEGPQRKSRVPASKTKGGFPIIGGGGIVIKP